MCFWFRVFCVVLLRMLSGLIRDMYSRIVYIVRYILFIIPGDVFDGTDISHKACI